MRRAHSVQPAFKNGKNEGREMYKKGQVVPLKQNHQHQDLQAKQAPLPSPTGVTRYSNHSTNNTSFTTIKMQLKNIVTTVAAFAVGTAIAGPVPVANIAALQAREENAQNSAQSADAVQAQHSQMEKQYAQFQATLQQKNQEAGANAPNEQQLAQIKQEVQNSQQAHKNDEANWCSYNCGGYAGGYGYSLYNLYSWWYDYYSQIYTIYCYGYYWNYCYYGNYYGNNAWNYYYWDQMGEECIGGED
ncbi:hypothetical protein CBER1_07759 [Cercospora berteroae]|uniref:Uncharacterized protein n=1 Tax=Cercospora berteroae TaxID=357750 RepID=A0A2S6C3V3_9PEZI|nr:hypothetical protein CBER1_07759 [Cercospora berteroae]